VPAAAAAPREIAEREALRTEAAAAPKDPIAEAARRIAEFDVAALLDLLAHHGCRREHLILKSHSTETSQATLLHHLEPRPEPFRAALTLNLGLLGPQTPLPSYFFQLLGSDDVDEESLIAFLGFFDHLLVGAFLASIYPENDPTVYRSFEVTKRHYLSLLGLRSTSALHWLFQSIFPELGTTVVPATLARRVKVEPARIGKTALGDGSTLGGTTMVPVPGFEITLFCDEEYTSTDNPWADEGKRRLEDVLFPVLRDLDLDLKVSLVIRSRRAWARLGRGSYLGFDRLRGGVERNRVVVIFKGVPA
jgi:hypothetical protein